MGPMKGHIVIGSYLIRGYYMTLYKLQSVFIVIVTLLILCGCSKEKQMLNTNIMETALNYEKEYFSVYQLDGMESFDHLIAGNPIDQDYDYDFTVKATTTAEMIAVQTKYAEIWKNEYDFANENLINTLDETNQSTFRNLQNNWEKI